MGNNNRTRTDIRVEYQMDSSAVERIAVAFESIGSQATRLGGFIVKVENSSLKSATTPSRPTHLRGSRYCKYPYFTHTLCYNGLFEFSRCLYMAFGSRIKDPAG